ncbi:ABC transporter permease [Chloroflexota bacterium]
MRVERSTWLMAGLILVVGGLVVYPLGMIFYGSFWSAPPGAPGHFTLEGYVEAYADPTIIGTLWTTFWLGAFRTVLATSIAIVFAWLLVRTDLPFKGPIEVMLWLPFFMPLMPMTMAWILLLSPHYGLVNQALKMLPFIDGPVFDVFTYGGIVWCHLFFSTSIRILFIAPAFRRMDASLEESARMCGARNITSILRITVPILMPSILAAAMLGFIKSLESFEIELLLGGTKGIYVYTTKIYDLVHFEPARYPPAMALTGVFMVVIFALIFLHRRMIGKREYVTVTGRGFSARPVSLGRWTKPVVAMFLVWIAVGMVLPVATLVLGSFMRYFGLFRGEWFTTLNWTKALGDTALLGAIKNTLLLGLGVAIGGILLYTVLSYVVIKTKVRGRGTLDFITWLPWAVPGLVLALGILWAYVGGIRLPFTLYGTLWIMMLAIVVKQMPVGMRMMSASMVQVSKELEECARVHGASWLYTARRILAPLLRPAFMSVGIIIFMAGVRELITVVLLYSPKSRVLSTIMLDYWLGDAPGRAVVVGLMIVTLVIIFAIVARVLGTRGELGG